MSRVLLQPAGDSVARANWKKTIKKAVPISRLASALTSTDYEDLELAFPSGSAQFWGAKRPNNKAHFHGLRPGDPVLFYWKKVYRASAVVVFKVESPKAAKRLWQNAEFSYVYGVQDVQEAYLDRALLHPLIGYGSSSPLRKFTLLTDQKSNAVLDGLSTGRLDMPAPDAASWPAFATNPDIPAGAIRRAEQQKLKGELLDGADEGPCHLCHRQLPRRLLIAAHIKRRAECTVEEKLDIPNVAMLACALGCDALFETGRVMVDSDGLIIAGSAVGTEPAVADYVEAHLAGKAYLGDLRPRQDYFAWHRRHHSPP